MTRSETVANDVAALLRARNPILWIVTKEESRVETYLFEAAAKSGYLARTWDAAQGICAIDGTKESFGSPDVGETLTMILARAERSVNAVASRDAWIMRDLAPWLDGTLGIVTCRQLANLARKIPSVSKVNAQAIIILSPRNSVPPELSGHTTVIEWPLPDRNEIESILDTILETMPKQNQNQNGTREAAIDAAVGLSGDEAAACYAKSIVTLRRIDPLVVAGEKKRIINKEKALEWFETLDRGFDAVGGLDGIKDWIRLHRCAYSREAREYGLPAPRGILLVGVSGCGKSLIAKAIATELKKPLLRYDMNAAKGKYVGESEANNRSSLRVIEAVGGVVWIDEIEKTTLNSSAQGAADGGVSSDYLGTFLSWMQERRGDAFLVATSNDVTSLPPELLRKGRFDEIFFVDLPNLTERREILSATLRLYRQELDQDSVETIARSTESFTGSEIATLVPEAMFIAFADSARKLTEADLLSVTKTVVPLAKTASEKIASLRSWAAERARPATSAVAAPKTSPLSSSFSRNLDL